MRQPPQVFINQGEQDPQRFLVAGFPPAKQFIDFGWKVRHGALFPVKISTEDISRAPASMLPAGDVPKT